MASHNAKYDSDAGRETGSVAESEDGSSIELLQDLARPQERVRHRVRQIRSFDRVNIRSPFDPIAWPLPSSELPGDQNMRAHQCVEVEFKEHVFTMYMLDPTAIEAESEKLHIDDVFCTWINMVRPAEMGGHNVPVPGSFNEQWRSTSSGVHVYADPDTQLTKFPTLYADCEGFSGHEIPVAFEALSSRLHDQVPKAPPREQRRYISRQEATNGDIENFLNSPKNRIQLEWGRILEGSIRRNGNVESETRRIIVENIYPRILYAFSNVVCFVTSNSRSSASFLSRLIDWAREGYDRILNRRLKPALIIVLNKDFEDRNRPGAQDPARALLRSFEQTSEFERLKTKWRHQGRNIERAEDLILCYYTSFNVVAIPVCRPDSPPALSKALSDQIKSLYTMIQDSSRLLQQERKEDARLDLAMLDTYLARSLRVLGRDYRASLNFHDLAYGDSPIPVRFSEHMEAAMFSLAKVRGLDRTQDVGGEQQLVDHFARYVAACISAQLPWNESPDIIQEARDNLVNEALRGLELFRNLHWRCEAQDRRRRRCKNYLPGHRSEHQFYLASGGERYEYGNRESMRRGHQCSWEPEHFKDDLWKQLSKLVNGEQSMNMLTRSAKRIGLLQVHSQRTCLMCLSHSPTNMLPCQGAKHGICQKCVHAFFHRGVHESVLTIDGCPLGCAFDTGTWSIRVKPQEAGPRILALDGGGVRGLVQLTILQQLEQQVGFGIPIDELFDLVIGTSTGGIVALGVFHQNMSPEDGVKMFEDLAGKAFSLRPKLKNPVIKSLVQPFCTFLYTTEGIEGALQEQFGEDTYLFGSSANDRNRPSSPDKKLGADWVKVGVVSCMEGRNRPMLIANYSRNSAGPNDGVYGVYTHADIVLFSTEDYLARQDNQENDFKVWEAARATSAAPIYFQPYLHHRTKTSYIDGGIVRNNPVQLAFNEYKMIWPNSPPPDVLVSLGTGVVVNPESGAIKDERRKKYEALTPLIPRGFRKQIETGYDMVRSTVDCQKAWEDFKESISHNRRLMRNCHRLNVGLTRRVNLDGVEHMNNLKAESKAYLSPRSRARYLDPNYDTASDHLEAVARRLLATLFYYIGTLSESMAAQRVEGLIFCRPLPGSSYAKNLLDSDIRFRLQQVREDGRRIVQPIQFEYSEPFEEEDLSADIYFRVNSGVFRRSIEVNLRHWRGI
ncbi:hypothetical protein BGZ63DRAFT_402245 [Mariannaea sp. PMI_226]|nr:hypothetical protein BGZ63DRAFT_402245 [Mariannaea sp. PMI_226]